MKKMVDFMNFMYFIEQSRSNENYKRSINYWCPTGMNPIIL